MGFFSSLASGSYKVSRAAGDIAAAQRGPGHYVRRRARRSLTRSIFRMFGL